MRVVEIEIPPLRARGAEDIADLAEHFVAQFARRYRKGPLRLAESGRTALIAYAWPGNVRELENTIERAVVLAPARRSAPRTSRSSGALRKPVTRSSVSRSCPPTPSGITLPPGLPLEEAERRYAKAILDREGGNQSAAARALGISRNKLARLLRG